MSYEISWWSELGSELGGAELKHYGAVDVALLGEQGAADVAILGTTDGQEKLICLSFAAVQDPLRIKQNLLEDDDFIRSVAPYTSKLTRRLRLQAGQAWLHLPPRRDGQDDEPKDVQEVVRSLARVLTRRAPVPSRRCVSCCAEDAKLVLRKEFPLRICKTCQEYDEPLSLPIFDKASFVHGHPTEPPMETSEEALARDEQSLKELLTQLLELEGKYENWLYQGLFASVGLIISMSLALLFLLTSHLPPAGLFVVLLAFVLTLSAPFIYAIIFARAHRFQDFRKSHPSAPLNELKEEQKKALLDWLHSFAAELPEKIDSISVNNGFDCTTSVCCLANSKEKSIHLELGLPLLLALKGPTVEMIIIQQILRANLARKYNEQERQGHIFSLAISFGYIEMWLLSSPLGPIVEPLFKRFGEHLFEYQAYLRSFQRRLEYEADKEAATLLGPQEYGKALTRAILDGHLVDVALDQWRKDNGSDEEFAEDDLLTVLQQGIAEVDEKTQSEMLEILLADEPLWTDSAPSLQNRLKAIGVSISEPLKIESYAKWPFDIQLFDSEFKKLTQSLGPSFSLAKRVKQNGEDWCRDLNELLQANRQSPTLYALLAEANGAACNEEAAVNAWRKLVELDETSAYARTKLLSLSLKRGQMGEAAWNVSYLLEQAPADKPFHWLENVTPQPWTTVTYAHSRIVLTRLISIVQSLLKEQGRSGQLRTFYEKLRQTIWNRSPRTDAFIMAKARLIGSARARD